MESRSQHQNKKIAIKRLKEKIIEHNNEQLKTSVKNKWENHGNLERGNPVRVFTGSDFKRKKVNKNSKSKRQESKKNLRQQKWD
jgi:peptide chain release factor